jgi:SpoVK/Ycf46/Vps4 family AAA+-type ATPase
VQRNPYPAWREARRFACFGPPGTGKTNFAEELARALGYSLILVTPSDFIRGGESQVEERAKHIFDVLSAQADAVVLLDEIDRMILDREAVAYERQGDIFQFMTPGMLTKLADLRKSKRVVFLIGTNYEEHIDAAAKRVGRLDDRLMLPPPDFRGRIAILRRLLTNAGLPPGALTGEGLRPAANATALMVFSELKQVVDGALRQLIPEERVDGGKAVEAVNVAAAQAPRPAISLESYQSRLTTRKYVQKPFREFFVLLYVKLDEGGTLSKEEQQVAATAVQQLVKLDQGALAALDDMEREDRVRQALWLHLNETRLVDIVLRGLGL